MRFPGISIRTTLMFLSLAILCIPWVGLEYLRELERYLRDALELSLKDTAHSLASPLQQSVAMFPTREEAQENTLYVHGLRHSIQIDGYTADWIAYLDWADVYRTETENRSEDPDAGFRLIVSYYDQYFNVLVQVLDQELVYQRPDTPGSLRNDHVRLVFTDPAGHLHTYYFSPDGPGRLRPFVIREQFSDYGASYVSSEYITNITGEWLPTEQGYNLELAIPEDIVGERMGFIVADFTDRDAPKLVSHIGTAGPGTETRPGRLLRSSPVVLGTDFGLQPGRRIWILDSRGQVLASEGNLDKDLPSNPVNIVYSMLLPPVTGSFRDELAGASRLQGEEVMQARRGIAGTRWRSSPDGRAIIVSAAVPVWIGDEVRGVVVVEETTSGLQMMQRQAMTSLFNKTVIVYLLVTVLLLLFATRLSQRIRRLSAGAEAAVDEHGRVVGSFMPETTKDEIGELSRGYAAMLGRLQQYNEYLEGLAGKLSHELRTPISVVQSSLEQLAEGGRDSVYVARARDGIHRLNLLVTRLSEAARIEQTLGSAQRQETDLALLLDQCLAGYRLAFPGYRFDLRCEAGPHLHPVAPELIVQMLDKLVSNAVDFGDSTRPVELTLKTGPADWRIEIVNYGSRLPDTMKGQLFNSMISVRDRKLHDNPHLGLGLYIVRLIAEFHEGRAEAENLPEGNGVRFQVRFRL